MIIDFYLGLLITLAEENIMILRFCESDIISGCFFLINVYEMSEVSDKLSLQPGSQI